MCPEFDGIAGQWEGDSSSEDEGGYYGPTPSTGSGDCDKKSEAISEDRPVDDCEKIGSPKVEESPAQANSMDDGLVCKYSTCMVCRYDIGD